MGLVHRNAQRRQASLELLRSLLEGGIHEGWDAGKRKTPLGGALQTDPDIHGRPPSWQSSLFVIRLVSRCLRVSSLIMPSWPVPEVVPTSAFLRYIPNIRHPCGPDVVLMFGALPARRLWAKNRTRTEEGVDVIHCTSCKPSLTRTAPSSGT